MKIFKTIAAVSLVCAVAFSGVVQAGTLTQTTSSGTLRAAAIATTADVLGTTVTLGGNVSAVHIYAPVSVGSSTSIVLTPKASYDPLVGSSSYHIVSTDYITTCIADGRYHLRIPKEALGGDTIGVNVKGIGTMTSSNVAVYYKTEQY